MLPQPDSILSCLDRHNELHDACRFVVAYSGGLDSTVLLDLARRALPGRPGASLLAVHVDHDLHASSKEWSAHCAAIARRFGVSYVSCRATVNHDDGESPEAAARAARYAALADHIGPGDVLMCAHHLDDQVETVLLQLTRGAGVAGLAGMPELAQFADGWCLRPFLSMARSKLIEYAAHYQLQWIDDPSNTDRRFDRNFLRHEIMPRISDRWPGASVAVARSASHFAAATRLLREFGAEDAEFVTAGAGTVDLQRLATLPTDRQDNALRSWLRLEGLPVPSTAHLGQVQKLIQTSATTGCVSWPGCELRRYRDRLYATLPLSDDALDFETAWSADSVLNLPANLGQLHCHSVSNGGLDPRRCGDNLTVRFRAGGEKLRPVGSGHRRKLRTLYQEAGVVPWMRDRIPLLYAGDRLAAVADLWVEQDLAADRGTRGLGVRWDNHPLLY